MDQAGDGADGELRESIKMPAAHPDADGREFRKGDWFREGVPFACDESQAAPGVQFRRPARIPHVEALNCKGEHGTTDRPPCRGTVIQVIAGVPVWVCPERRILDEIVITPGSSNGKAEFRIFPEMVCSTETESREIRTKNITDGLSLLGQLRLCGPCWNKRNVGKV